MSSVALILDLLEVGFFFAILTLVSLRWDFKECELMRTDLVCASRRSRVAGSMSARLTPTKSMRGSCRKSLSCCCSSGSGSDVFDNEGFVSAVIGCELEWLEFED